MFSDGSENVGTWAIQDAKEPTETREITGLHGVAVAVAVASGEILDPSAAELLAVWNVLDDAARQDLLAIARGLAGTRQRGNTP